MIRQRLFLLPLIFSIVAFWAVSASGASAKSLAIKNANYSQGSDQVIVSGSLGVKSDGQQVSLFVAGTQSLLGEYVTDKKNFKFHLAQQSLTGVPCAVTVVTSTGSVSADVKHAPADCNGHSATLHGRVVDAPLPGAIVKVTVGGQIFLTQADADGYYSVDITTLLLTDLVLIEASGATEANPGVVVDFVSVVGAFSKTLSDEPQNVTNVTTAQFTLLVQANGGAPITTVEQLVEAEKSVDATQLLQLAAVIKLIVDDPNFAMPLDGGGNPYASLLDFVADTESVNTFVAAVTAADPVNNPLADAMAAIVNQSGLLPLFSVDKIPFRFYALPAAHMGYLSRGGDVMEFNADFTGAWISSDNSGNGVDADFTWDVVDGQLVVTFPQSDPASFYSGLTDVIEDAGVTDQQIIDDYYNCRVEYVITGRVDVLEMTFTLLNDGTLINASQRESSQVVDFDPIPLDPGCGSDGDYIYLDDLLSIGTDSINLRDASKITPVPFTNTLVEGKWGTYTFYDPKETIFGTTPRGINYDIQTFLDSGTMSAKFNEEPPGTWSIVDGSLVINYPDGMVQTITIIDRKVGNSHEYGLFHEFDDGTGRSAIYDLGVKVDPGFAFNAVDLVNPFEYFWNGMINAWQAGAWDNNNALLLNQYWGWDFETDGTGGNAQYGVFGGVSYWYAFPLDWSISGDGAVQINYRGDRTRYWLPLAADIAPTGERRMYMMEWEDIGGERRINPRVNMQMEFPHPDPALYDIYEPW